jgi:hypothetical protein
VKDNGFPWARVEGGPEPRLPDDFASRVIEKARMTRVRKRRAKITLGTTVGFAILAVVMQIWMRSMPANKGTAAQHSAISAYAATEENNALLAFLMPDAPQAQSFDRYYGPAGWNAYASWDPVSYDSYR